MELQKFCELFYASHYIPITIYKNQDFRYTYPDTETAVDFQIALAPYIISSGINPEILSPSDLGLYGLIHIQDSDEFLLIGPVFHSPVTESTVLAIARQIPIAVRESDDLSTFLRSVPTCSYKQFINLITYLHYCLNGEVFDIMSDFRTDNQASRQHFAAMHTVNFYNAKEQRLHYSAFQFENTMISYIRDGETEKLKQLLSESLKTTDIQEGVLADSPLRQAKNLLINLIPMVGKIGAIGGGMDIEEAYRLMDLYFLECERSQSVNAVKLLQYNMIIDFTERVAKCKVPKNTSKEIFLCMQFIQNHTCYSIGIDEVVACTGKSRSHVTKRFREETGISIGDYITQCKIRDAKRLLRYTDQSLVEISNYLCYSSQSYFQTVFKKETGMTPNEYRKKNGFSGIR